MYTIPGRGAMNVYYRLSVFGETKRNETDETKRN